MNISIRELEQSNFDDLNRCNGSFIVDSKLCLLAQNDQITYTIVSVPQYEKRYPLADIDYRTYIGVPDKAIYLAYGDGQIVGQIILRQNWNHYAYIEDIAVDAQFRKCGLGRALIARAITWAKERHLPGLMLETQNNNVSACRFYEACGFRLKGFDTQLYRAIDPASDEIALFWYLIF